MPSILRKKSLNHGVGCGQLDDLDQATARSICDRYVAPGPANDFAGYCQTKAGSRNLLSARTIGTEEGFEHLVHEVRRNTRPLIGNRDPSSCTSRDTYSAAHTMRCSVDQ